MVRKRKRELSQAQTASGDDTPAQSADLPSLAQLPSAIDAEVVQGESTGKKEPS